MRVVLRSAESGLFFLGSGRWTPSRNAAFDFERPEKAAKTARGLGLDRMEVVFVSEFGAEDMIVPLELVREDGGEGPEGTKAG